MDPEVRCEIQSSATNVEIDSASYRDRQAASSQLRCGQLVGPDSSAPPASPTSQSGKIDLTGAAASALSGGIDTTSNALLPQVFLHADDKVSVRSLSWIDVIRRKHGML